MKYGYIVSYWDSRHMGGPLEYMLVFATDPLDAAIRAEDRVPSGYGFQAERDDGTIPVSGGLRYG